MTEPADATFIERFDPPGGTGPRVAVKDLIDVAGSVTTAGCRYLAEHAAPATSDAPCVAAVRAGGGRLVGKANLHELAFGVSGVNPWFGTPVNPADPGRIPGGSSSGSAVAVATGEADLALGSDTGGSIRIPAACCGVAGLKTTHGRLSLEGVWPLAPSYDTIGPLAADVAGLVRAMALLEPGFAPDVRAPARIGRARLPGVPVDPVVEAAVDGALRAAGLEVVPLTLDRWEAAWRDQQLLLGAEALEADGGLLEASGGEGIGAETLARFARSRVAADERTAAARRAAQWTARLTELVGEAGLVALPTLAVRPPRLGEEVRGLNLLTAPVNLAGLPALSVPVPAAGRPPAGLQLVGPPGSEEVLLAAGAAVEQALSGAPG